MVYNRELIQRAKAMVLQDKTLYEEDCIEELKRSPLVFNAEDSFDLYIQRERIKHHL